MRILAPFIIVISLFAANFAAIQVVAQESDAPFIYYYSPDDRAIVIERADGADRNYIRNPQLPLDHDQGFGLEWSPSGEWVAWQSGKTSQGPFRWIEEGTKQGWISRFDGSVTFQIPTTSPDSLIWSPTQDILLVNSRTPFSTQEFQTVYSIPDLEVLVREETHADWLWTPDGNLIYEVNLEESPIFLFYDLDRQNFERQYTGTFLWLPDNRLLYQVTDQSAVVEDLVSQQATAIPISLPFVSDVVWSGDQRHALIYTPNPPDETIPYEGYSIWLFDWTNYSLQLVETEAAPRQTWEFGIGSSTLLNNWVPTDDRVIISTIDGEVFWVDITTLTRTQIDLPLRPVDQPEYPLLGSQWQSNGYLSLLSWGGEVWEYDLNNDSLSDQPILARWHYTLSDSGQYLALMGSCNSTFDDFLDGGKCIMNRDTGDAVELPPNRFNHRAMIGSVFSDLNWHSSRDWILFGEDGGVTSSAFYYSAGLASGGIYRDIADCGDEFACVNWLPENVPIGD